jgi:hypothetical protein
MMVKIPLFVVTMVKVARLGSGAPYAGSGTRRLSVTQKKSVIQIFPSENM